jgi:hypothetical protein|tara:strand:- start:107 stop:322 length:216 start_codon:yes stop_codon:yes gene_type:complete
VDIVDDVDTFFACLSKAIVKPDLVLADAEKEVLEGRNVVLLGIAGGEELYICLSTRAASIGPPKLGSFVEG